MLYYLSQYILEATAGAPLGAALSPLRVFRYITFRSAGAAVTALLLSLWLGPKVIAWLRELKFGQAYRDKAEETAKLERQSDKRGVPTMGGLLIVLVIDFTVVAWARWNPLVLLSLVLLVGLAGLGFYDDYAKIARQSSRGATMRLKLLVQTGLALFAAVYLWINPDTKQLITEIMAPFCKHAVLTNATIVGIALTVMAIVGSSNAVNLTDGLDGLAIGCTLIVTTAFVIMTYVAGHSVFAAYLKVPYVPGAGELTIVCTAVFGAGLGFLWFNAPPATVFMGDTGSLALGGVLGVMAVLIHQPLVLLIAGGVFVAEAGSVVIQILCCQYYRRFHGIDRRVFLMTPLHHHFECLKWAESKIVMRFYILCILCAVMALATLKLR